MGKFNDNSQLHGIREKRIGTFSSVEKGEIIQVLKHVKNSRNIACERRKRTTTVVEEKTDKINRCKEKMSQKSLLTKGNMSNENIL